MTSRGWKWPETGAQRPEGQRSACRVGRLGRSFARVQEPCMTLEPGRRNLPTRLIQTNMNTMNIKKTRTQILTIAKRVSITLRFLVSRKNTSPECWWVTNVFSVFLYMGIDSWNFQFLRCLLLFLETVFVVCSERLIENKPLQPWNHAHNVRIRLAGWIRL